MTGPVASVGERGPHGRGPRPRDALGRPLPYDADPALVVPGVPEREEVSTEVAVAEARAYLEAGRPFHAHEVFEQRWRCCPRPERDLWRGLAQWAAALTHAARGNGRGARAVARRAAVTLGAWPGAGTSTGSASADVPISVAEVIASCGRLVNNPANAPTQPDHMAPFCGPRGSAS